jgi:hypothetical protein
VGGVCAGWPGWDGKTLSLMKVMPKQKKRGLAKAEAAAGSPSHLWRQHGQSSVRFGESNISCVQVHQAVQSASTERWDASSVFWAWQHRVAVSMQTRRRRFCNSKHAGADTLAESHEPIDHIRALTCLIMLPNAFGDTRKNTLP